MRNRSALLCGATSNTATEIRIVPVLRRQCAWRLSHENWLDFQDQLRAPDGALQDARADQGPDERLHPRLQVDRISRLAVHVLDARASEARLGRHRRRRS